MDTFRLLIFILIGLSLVSYIIIRIVVYKKEMKKIDNILAYYKKRIDENVEFDSNIRSKN